MGRATIDGDVYDFNKERIIPSMQQEPTKEKQRKVVFLLGEKDKQSPKEAGYMDELELKK